MFVTHWWQQQIKLKASEIAIQTLGEVGKVVGTTLILLRSKFVQFEAQFMEIT